jgi:hypothetical protein
MKWVPEKLWINPTPYRTIAFPELPLPPFIPYKPYKRPVKIEAAPPEKKDIKDAK